MLCIVTVVDSISTTSMPVNEFVIYRSAHNYDIHQAMIVCDTIKPTNVTVPENVDVFLVKNDRKEIRKAVKEIQLSNGNKANSIVYHMHHQKSALVFLLATMGMDVRKHTLYTIHSTYSARNFKYKISSCICSILAKYANCVSKTALEEYSPLVRGIKGGKILTVQNGVDIERIDSVIEKEPEKIRNKKVLICIGRMIPLKNHEFLIHLMKDLPEFKLVLIGAEDNEKKIRKLAQVEQVLDRITILGLIPRNEVFSRLNGAGIYVSASYIEGLPVSVLEAMRVGLIPVISKIKPHQEIAEKCKDISVLPLEKERWIETIRNLGYLSNEEFQRKSNVIKKSAKIEFSLDKMHSKYMKIYQNLD